MALTPRLVSETFLLIEPLMMIVQLLPAFRDNYIFVCVKGSEAIVVDPGESQVVSNFLAKHRLQLKYILVTHHHWDHTNGVNELKNATSAKVLGSRRIDGIHVDHLLQDGDTFEFAGSTFITMALPGHTLDHLGYYSKEAQVLFCGDVLFSLGCGRVFEGTFEQMYESLAKIKSLANETKVYCAHEYTLKNADFSLSYLKQSSAPRDKLEYYEDLRRKIEQTRNENVPTIPTTLEFEKKNNLFLNVKNLDEFKKLRIARNEF